MLNLDLEFHILLLEYYDIAYLKLEQRLKVKKVRKQVRGQRNGAQILLKNENVS